MPDATQPRYFTFSDDTSHKFWQITVDGASYTATYGRIGSAGQSSAKTFDSAEKCAAEAEKIIREKTGKGYVEEVDGAAVTHAATPKKRSGKSGDAVADTAAVEETIATFNTLLERGDANGLLPFLQAANPAHYSALRKRIKVARRHYDEYVELKPGEGSNASREKSWGYRGTAAQRTIAAFAGLALLPRDELKSFSFLHLLSNWEWRELGADILAWAQPAWFTEYVAERSRAEVYETPRYEILRAWEEAGYIHHHPELFARAVSHYNPYHISYRGTPLSQDYVDYLCTDETARTRDIPLLFLYETDAHNTAGWEAPPGETRREKLPVWPRVFARMLQEGTLDRATFLEGCISVQTKEWNSALRAFFRREAEAMQPTTAEWMAMQPMLFPLLGAAHPHVVNWAAGILKDISSEADFSWEEFLQWAPAVMMRGDCKGAVKTLLSVVEKRMRSSPVNRTSLASILPDVFLTPDLPLQTKAASLLTKYADPTDEELTEKLRGYADAMLGTLRTELAAFLSPAESVAQSAPVAVPGAAETYQYAPAPVLRLADCAPVTLPQKWNDYLFLFGEVMSGNLLSLELLINAVIAPPAGSVAVDNEQLQPYLRQIAAAHSDSWIWTYTRAWLLHAFSGEDGCFRFKQEYQTSISTLKLQLQRLEHADTKRWIGSRLPMLSLPSHHPGFIAADVLVQRLLDYAAAGEDIDPLELAIAIARTHPDGAADAAQLCTGLPEPLRGLMHFFLTGEGTPPAQSRRGILHRLFRGAEGSTPDDEIYALWAVAARTREPDGVFDFFEGMLFGDAPNVSRPFPLQYTLVQQWYEAYDWQTKTKTRKPNGYELELQLPASAPRMPLLLYSGDVHQAPANAWWSRHLSEYDAIWWMRLVPWMPEGLYTTLLTTACRRSALDASATAGLRGMLSEHFQFREASTLVLACGLTAEKREDRALAGEVLIAHFAQQTVDAAAVGDRLGWLLREGYAPVQRAAESLALVRDVSPLHNAGLKALLEGAFVELGLASELPKNTKKLLEMYLDVLVKTEASPSSQVRDWLMRHAASGAVKSIVSAILKIQ